MTQPQQQLEFGNLPPRRPLLRVLRETPATRVMQAQRQECQSAGIDWLNTSAMRMWRCGC